MAFRNRELILVYVIGVFLGGILVSKVILAPFRNRLVSLERGVAVAEARLKKGLSLLQRKEEIEKQYVKYAAYFSHQGLSGDEAVADFLKEIERLSRECGLTVLDMKPQKEVAGDKFSKQFQLNIRAEAGMGELVKFLYALQESTFLFSVEKMTLVPKGEEASTLSIAMTVAGVIFL